MSISHTALACEVRAIAAKRIGMAKHIEKEPPAV